MQKKLTYSLISLIIINIIFGCEPEVAKPPKKEEKVTVSSVYDKMNKNTYQAVKIGAQYWFQSNLDSKIYAVRKKVEVWELIDTINSYTPYTTSIAYLNESPLDDTLAVQWPFNGYDSLTKKYGRMYTWYAASDARNICPTGWHVPNESEWDKMIAVLGGDSLAGGKMKDTSTIEWNYPNLAEVNQYNLKVKSTGYRSEFGSYVNQGKFTFFWSSSSDPDDKDYGIAYAVYAHTKKIYKQPKSKRIAMSIRCVR
jgi:uncharacterized protein (TIGR02145 family)